MSTPRNDGDTTPRTDAKHGPDPTKGPDLKEGSDRKDDPDAKESPDAKENSNAEGSNVEKGHQRKSAEEQLANLKEKKDQLQNRIDQLLMKARARERKQDTRRKIIIGGIVQRVAEQNEKIREWLRKQIEKHVKERDRELFRDILKNQE